jgi:hypothetical protein
MTNQVTDQILLKLTVNKFISFHGDYVNEILSISFVRVTWLNVRTEMVPETSAIFEQLTGLIYRQDSIKSGRIINCVIHIFSFDYGS